MQEKWTELLHFSLPSQPGMERVAMERAAGALHGLLSDIALERLKTAVAEGTLNAIEHGNHFQEDLPVEVNIWYSPSAVRVNIIDQGGSQMIPESSVPDIDAKLAGLESTRGWGMFLIRNMVDEVRITGDGQRHTLELVSYRESNP